MIEPIRIFLKCIEDEVKEYEMLMEIERQELELEKQK